MSGTAFAAGHEVTVTVSKNNGKPVKDLEVYTFVQGTEEVTVIDSNDEFIIEDVNDGNIISLIIGDTIYDIPVEGVKSIHIYMNNNSTFNGYSADGGNMVTATNTRSVNSQPWVRGAVDRAVSQMYTSILNYVRSRVVGVRPIRMRFGEIGLAINGNGNRPALIIVDGVPTSFDMLNAMYRPWQISRIEVDRMGARWGTRGRNGVVTFTTNVFQ